ncbi:DUF3313 domain-containing protein [Aerophototrophica crusticola]|uniref:DUF3313 domain-containing protein n=1 Tax=Aerophototrophica crusticola TaxID=1709002 RepID=A0A858R5C7_9PROT|nr:DUF3313 domain-containing protein [Rhodospirillaceae bacterium B3]
MSNPMRPLTTVATLSLLMLAPLSAQAATPPNELPVQGLQRVEDSDLDKVYVRPGTDLRSYGKVLLAPINVAVTRERGDLEFSDRDRRHAAEYFTERLRKSLGSAVTEQPGPGVLRLEVTVTEFVPNSPADPRRRFGGYFLDSVGVGAAAFQATLTDSQSGQVVAVLADADVGAPFPENLNIRTEYGDADNFLRRWARQIAGLVESGPKG